MKMKRVIQFSLIMLLSLIISSGELWSQDDWSVEQLTDNRGRGTISDIAIDGDGNIHIVYSEGKTQKNYHDYDIYYIKKSGGIWSTPVCIDQTFADDKMPTIAVDVTDDQVYIAFCIKPHLPMRSFYRRNQAYLFVVTNSTRRCVQHLGYLIDLIQISSAVFYFDITFSSSHELPFVRNYL